MPSPMTPPVGRVGTNCLAMLTGKFATLLIAVSESSSQRVRAADEEVHHVVRLVEEHRRLAPGALLAAPVA